MSDESTLISEMETIGRSVAQLFHCWTKDWPLGDSVVLFALFAVDATYWTSAQLSFNFDNSVAVILRSHPGFCGVYAPALAISAGNAVYKPLTRSSVSVLHQTRGAVRHHGKS
jgi:hypothetical protein